MAVLPARGQKLLHFPACTNKFKSKSKLNNLMLSYFSKCLRYVLQWPSSSWIKTNISCPSPFSSSKIQYKITLWVFVFKKWFKTSFLKNYPLFNDLCHCHHPGYALYACRNTQIRILKGRLKRQVPLFFIEVASKNEKLKGTKAFYALRDATYK